MTRMCTTNWKCILSSLCQGGGTGVLYIVIWRMSICTKVFPRLGCRTTRQQQLEMMGFKADTFNRKHAGVRWETGSHPSSGGDCKSPPPHPPQPRRKGQPQQVSHTDWISAFQKTIPLLSNYKLYLQNGAAFQTRKVDFLLDSHAFFRLVSNTFSQAASLPVSHHVHLQNKLRWKTTTLILHVQYLAKSIRTSRNFCTAHSVLSFVLAYISQSLIQSAATELTAFFFFPLNLLKIQDVYGHPATVYSEKNKRGRITKPPFLQTLKLLMGQILLVH